MGVITTLIDGGAVGAIHGTIDGDGAVEDVVRICCKIHEGNLSTVIRGAVHWIEQDDCRTKDIPNDAEPIVPPARTVEAGGTGVTGDDGVIPSWFAKCGDIGRRVSARVRVGGIAPNPYLLFPNRTRYVLQGNIPGDDDVVESSILIGVISRRT